MPDDVFLKAPTFTQWLYSVRDGAFGSLATFAIDDRWAAERSTCWPAKARKLVSFIRHVRSVHGGARDIDVPSERTIRAAWVAYEADLRAGVRIVSRVVERRVAADARRPIKSYTVAPGTPDRLAVIASRIGAPSGGATIDALVERYFDEDARD